MLNLSCRADTLIATQYALRLARRTLPHTLMLTVALTASLSMASAQDQKKSPTPAAPQAPTASQSTASDSSGSTSATAPQSGTNENNSTKQASGAAQESLNSARVSMAPHPAEARYWISGQANIIYQGRLPFHSLYEDVNSFRSSAEYKTSMVGTLYLGLRPTRSIRYNTDLIFDGELATGRGLSQALGVAGFTNLDVVRNPNLGPTPYVARYGFHQVIGLTDKTIEQQTGVFSFAPSVPERRFELRAGKMSVPDFFDCNGPASDSHLQFMNWTVDNNGAWDYAADTRGYTIGAMAEYDERRWSIRYGFFAMPKIANGIDLDWTLSHSHGQNGEFESRHSFVSGRRGVTRILFYANRAHMGNYREAVAGFLNGSDHLLYGVTVPTITLHEHVSALKYGFGYNMEQELTADLRLFGRFGWNEGQQESFAYTEVDQTIEGGFDLVGTRWKRAEDKFGFAVVSNAIKRDHQNYLKDGGLGFLLGDGTLNYGRETIVESYYTWHIWRGLFSSVDVQHINNPGYNRDRGPAWVGSVRAHIDF